MFEGLPDWLKVLLTGVGGIGAGGYTVSRVLKRDKASDTLDEKATGIITRLENQLEAERKNNVHMGETIDRLAGERNHAVQQVGRLEGTVHALESEVGRLRTEIQGLELKNSELTREIRGLTESVQLMLQQNAMLVAGRHLEGVQQ